MTSITFPTIFTKGPDRGRIKMNLAERVKEWDRKVTNVEEGDG